MKKLIEKKINFSNKFSGFSKLWHPHIIAEMNEYEFKLVKIKGEFVWHSHNETDEVFIVIEGQMTIRFREGEVSLKENEMYVVPKGVEHMPIATNECKILLIEPKGIINTGDIKNQLTVKKETWI